MRLNAGPKSAILMNAMGILLTLVRLLLAMLTQVWNFSIYSWRWLVGYLRVIVALVWGRRSKCIKCEDLEKQLQYARKGDKKGWMEHSCIDCDHCSSMQKLIEEKENEIYQLKEEKQELLERFSRKLERDIGRSEESLENISRPNRPMKIADEYQVLASSDWLTAKLELDKLVTDNEHWKMTALSCVYTVTFEECRKKFEQTINTVCQTLPGINELSIDQSSKSSSQELRDSLVTALRNAADRVKPEGIIDVETVWTSVLQNSSSPTSNLPDLQAMPAITHYIHAVAKLCWKMVTQKPPVTFDTLGQGSRYQGDQLQDVFWGSDDPSNPDHVILFYVHPALSHGHQLLVKGKVICGRGRPKEAHFEAMETE